MAVLRINGLDGFLKRPDPAIGVLLIHGVDSSTVHDLVVQSVKRLAGSIDDPFNVVRLDEFALAGDPARLVDEAQAFSMLGGSKVIWLRGDDQAVLKAIELVLSGPASNNMVVIEAGQLANSSPLRKACEASGRAMVLAVYDDANESAQQALETAAKRAGLRLQPEARDRFQELMGKGGVAVQREIEKILLYCSGAESISASDIDAVCGELAWAELNDIADAVFEGGSGLDRFIDQTRGEGVDAGRLLITVHQHVWKLIEIRRNMENGGRAEQAIASVKPPIFFKRQSTIRRQIELWPLNELMAAAASLGMAVAMTREKPVALLSDSIAARTLYALARTARIAATR
ncbi:DNA polymerase III subunit delta [Aestuariivirga sp.]|uniref:DNA polymerase III subunit delta n=1 Tax=Aestuariivirga sp. TaxID=2650926 RepID=UPI0039E56792